MLDTFQSLDISPEACFHSGVSRTLLREVPPMSCDCLDDDRMTAEVLRLKKGVRCTLKLASNLQTVIYYNYSLSKSTQLMIGAALKDYNWGIVIS